MECYVYVRFIWFKVQLNSNVSLLIFCLYDISIFDSSVLNLWFYFLYYSALDFIWLFKIILFSVKFLVLFIYYSPNFINSVSVFSWSFEIFLKITVRNYFSGSLYASILGGQLGEITVSFWWCLSVFVLPLQNTWYWIIHKEYMCCHSRSWKQKIRALVGFTVW